LLEDIFPELSLLRPTGFFKDSTRWYSRHAAHESGPQP
jgi:hypothetical protein